MRRIRRGDPDGRPNNPPLEREFALTKSHAFA